MLLDPAELLLGGVQPWPARARDRHTCHYSRRRPFAFTKEIDEISMAGDPATADNPVRFWFATQIAHVRQAIDSDTLKV